MKKILLAIPLISLTACVGNNAQTYVSEISQRTKLEEQAIQNADKEVGTRCAKGLPQEKIPRSKFVKFNECATEVFEGHVLPVAPFPESFMKFRAKTLENAQAYQDGKISLAQSKARNKIAWVEYTEDRQAHARGNLQHLDALDAQERAEMRDVMANMPQPVTPIITTCNTAYTYNGGTTRCTTR